MYQPNLAVRRTRTASFIGLGAGVIIEAPAVVAAIMSAGAGHGAYVAARILFPFSMLLTLIEGAIGPIAMSVGLLQFPLYGALAGRTMASKSATLLVVLVVAHAVAVLACFSGVLQRFL